MYRFKKHIALFLLCVLSVYIVPKEFIHALYGHEDTVDHHTSSVPAPLAVGLAHTHCDILNFETDVFSTSESRPAFTPVALIFKYLPLPLQSGASPVTSFVSLRGPPQC